MYITRLQNEWMLVKKTKRAVHFNVLHEVGKKVTVDESDKYDGVYLFIAKGVAVKCRFATFFWRIKRFLSNRKIIKIIVELFYKDSTIVKECKNTKEMNC